MVTDKPFMIAPEVASPDYAGRLRRTFAARRGDGGGFGQALETQQAAVRPAEDPRRNSVSTAPDAPTRETVKEAGAEKLRAGLPLERRERAAQDASLAGLTFRREGGMALDRRSLSLLEALGNRGGERTRTVKKTTGSDAVPRGRLSARYESGAQGAAAIGYDRNGGTSYGTYQISSRQGTFNRFLDFLDGKEPALAERLRKAGPADTGGTRGGVPTEWKAIAAEQPERFEALQEEFIRDSHYAPALEDVRGVLGVEDLSPALQEVLWSTAVQHGPTGAKRLFSRAAAEIAASGGDPRDEAALIDSVYSLRKGQFASSTPGVRAAVSHRFDDERRQALAMVRKTAVLA